MLSKAKIKELKKLQQKKYREESGLYLIEGESLLAEALVSGCVKEVFVSESCEALSQKFLSALKTAGLREQIISDADLKQIAQTQNPQGLMALCRIKAWSLSDFGPGPILALDRVSDPGNLGTLFRSAAAFGGGGILLSDACVEPHNDKVLRGSMGGVFALPHVAIKSEKEFLHILGEFKQAGRKIFAALPDKGQNPYREGLPDSCVFLLGNEAQGLRQNVQDTASQNICLPMMEKVESINVAMAGSALLSLWFGERAE